MFAPGADSLPPLSLLQHVSEWVGQDNTVCCESLRQATIHHAYTTPVPGLTGWCVRGPLVCSQLLAKAKVSGSAAVTGKGGTDSMQVKSCVYFLSKSKDLTLRSGTLPFFSVFFLDTFCSGLCLNYFKFPTQLWNKTNIGCCWSWCFTFNLPFMLAHLIQISYYIVHLLLIVCQECDVKERKSYMQG